MSGNGGRRKGESNSERKKKKKTMRESLHPLLGALALGVALDRIDFIGIGDGSGCGGDRFAKECAPAGIGTEPQRLERRAAQPEPGHIPRRRRSAHACLKGRRGLNSKIIYQIFSFVKEFF
jgi:hypothetical protein